MDDGDMAAPTLRQKKIYFLQNFIPFIGFGFFDNAIMLLAGDFLDARLGLAFGITTLAAAALGNTLSDVCGLFISGIIEATGAALGLPTSGLSDDQLGDPLMRFIKNAAMVSGITLGCFLGMFPLLYPEVALEVLHTGPGPPLW